MSIPSEFSRFVQVDQLGDEADGFEIEASAGELALLARRLDLVALRRLVAQGRVRRENAGRVVVEGSLEASVVQRCVATLEPFEDEAAIPFKRVFVQGLTEEEEEDLDPDDLDVEPLYGGTIDLGEIVSEELSVNLDPYPRGPNADAALAERGVLSEEEAEREEALAKRRQSPFANLADRLLGKGGGG